MYTSSYIIGFIAATSHKHYGVSHHSKLDCLLKSVFRLTAMKSSMICITGHLLGEPSVPSDLPAQRDWLAMQKAVLCHDVIISINSVTNIPISFSFMNLRAVCCLSVIFVAYMLHNTIFITPLGTTHSSLSEMIHTQSFVFLRMMNILAEIW